MIDNYEALDKLARTKHAESVSVLFTAELDHNPTLKNLFKPLLMIIQPGRGFTIAHQDAFFDGVNMLAGPLVGHIMVCSSLDLDSFLERSLLNSQDLQLILKNEHSLQDFRSPPSHSFI